MPSHSWGTEAQGCSPNLPFLCRSIGYSSHENSRSRPEISLCVFLSVLNVVEPLDVAITLIKDKSVTFPGPPSTRRCSPRFIVRGGPRTGVECGGMHHAGVRITAEHKMESKARALQARGSVRQDFRGTYSAITGSKCFPKYFFTFGLGFNFLLLFLKFTFSFHVSGSTLTLSPLSLR